MALKNYKNDPSMNAITERMKILGKFYFAWCTVKELNKLKHKNASQKTDIPIKIVKENANIKTPIL